MSRGESPAEGAGAAAASGENCVAKRLPDPTLQADVIDRLKRIEGQARGVQKMVQDRRDCGDIIIQLTAIKAAISQVCFTVLNCHLAESIQKDLDEGRDFRTSLDESMAILRKFA